MKELNKFFHKRMGISIPIDIVSCLPVVFEIFYCTNLLSAICEEWTQRADIINDKTCFYLMIFFIVELNISRFER